MNHTEKLDQDAVLRARTMLLGSGRLSPMREIEAYRVLAGVGPLTYLPKLCEALISYGYEAEFRGRPDIRLALSAEAVDVARRIDTSLPQRTELLARALSAYEFELYEAGRRTEGLAICEELAETWGASFEQGKVNRPVYGYGRLAVVLAEDGRHAEAAEIYGRVARAERSESPGGASFWTMVQWAAELDAAGRQDEALEAFAELVDDLRRDFDAGRTSSAILTWSLVHRSRMLDTAGRHAEAREARKEVLVLLAALGDTGERRSWSNILSWWTTLFALSGRSAEPAGTPSAPAPPVGSQRRSPPIPQAYHDSQEPREADTPLEN
ncbi:hypothetical protein, partial [Streptomyces sp. NPDC058964]|uniref:hypothetical protein n=1 Tax=Streptomyces sp. NPDC058964 TaxID=3346681 RepID=UPI003680931A